MPFWASYHALVFASQPIGAASKLTRHSTGGRTASMRAAVRTVATMNRATNPPKARSSKRLSRG